MTTIFILILLISVLLLLVGLINPKWVLIGSAVRSKSRKTVLKYFGLVIIGSLIILSGLLSSWVMSATLLIIMIGIISLISIVVGLIKPKKIFSFGNRKRLNILIQYTGLIIITLVTLVLIVEQVQDEGDTFIVLGEYNGERKDGHRHGQGRLENNAAYYDGNWENGKRNGFGRQVDDYGLFVVDYEGNWKNDNKDGLGTQTIKVLWMTMTYEGEWKNDKRHGFGTFTDRNGGIYEGEWVDDSPNGQGKMLHKNGETYEGEVKGWNKHGYGKAVLTNGEVMEGEWIEDEFVD